MGASDHAGGRSVAVSVRIRRRYYAMPQTQHTQEEVARVAEEIYRRDIRNKVMPQHKGKFLTLDIESGDYEIDEDDLTGEKRLRARHSDETGEHAVRVAAGSLLERTLGMRAATVNSRHHQAIRDLAPGLKAVAWADDGVIEGAEPSDANAPWMVAVQWHPEDLTERALFDGFARAVA